MKEKARHILCLAFLKSGEKNMEKILIYQVKEKEAVKQLLAPMKIRLEEIEARFTAEYRRSRRGKKERTHSTIYRQRTTGEPYGILRCE